MPQMPYHFLWWLLARIQGAYLKLLKVLWCDLAEQLVLMDGICHGLPLRLHASLSDLLAISLSLAVWVILLSGTLKMLFLGLDS